MRKLFLALALLLPLFALPAFGQEATEEAAESAAVAQETIEETTRTIDMMVNDAISPISNAVVSVIFYAVPIAGVDFPLIVGWLVLAATVFTLYFGFIQFRVFGHAIALVRGDYADPKRVRSLTSRLWPRLCRGRWAWATSPVSASPSRSGVRGRHSG